MYRYRRRRYKRGRKRRVLAFLLLVFAFVFAELRLPEMKAELRTAALTAHAQECIAKTVPEYLPQTVCGKGRGRDGAFYICARRTGSGADGCFAEKFERHGKGVCAARKFNGADAFERARDEDTRAVFGGKCRFGAV